jgi:hypothetical protein
MFSEIDFRADVAKINPDLITRLLLCETNTPLIRSKKSNSLWHEIRVEGSIENTQRKSFVLLSFLL